MALPSLTGTGRLTADPELRFSQQGTAVATVPLAFNSRKFNKSTGEWEDADVCFLRGTVFGDAAEHAVETYRRGDEVVVSGRVKTDRWADRQTGEQRSATSMVIDGIGASTRFATAAITRAEKRGGSQPAEDPVGASSEEPPF